MIHLRHTFNSEKFRHGFKGWEMEEDLKGEENGVAFKCRKHDPKIYRFLLPLLVLIIGCNQNNYFNDNEIDNDTAQNKEPDSNSELEGDIDSLHKVWKWNEVISEPEYSEITNFNYSSNILFGDWGGYDGEKFEFLFTIDETSFRPKGLEYKYTINYDSIRIFTKVDWSDGVHRGIISKLTADSLVIQWSTGDSNVCIQGNR